MKEQIKVCGLFSGVWGQEGSCSACWDGSARVSCSDKDQADFLRGEQNESSQCNEVNPDSGVMRRRARQMPMRTG
jgi:hypothetical protein